MIDWVKVCWGAVSALLLAGFVAFLAMAWGELKRMDKENDDGKR